MQARYRYRIEPTEARLATIANPKRLARKQRTLARLEREKPRRAKGSGNRAEARRKVAINILAAGRAERQNACGADVSPPCGEAAGEEAGSTPGAA